MSEKDVIKETKPRMETVIEDFRRKMATIRTGRAAVSILDTVMVDYYGTMTPLNQMASVHAPEPQMLPCSPGIKLKLRRRESDSRFRPRVESFERRQARAHSDSAADRRTSQTTRQAGPRNRRRSPHRRSQYSSRRQRAFEEDAEGQDDLRRLRARRACRKYRNSPTPISAGSTSSPNPKNTKS